MVLVKLLDLPEEILLLILISLDLAGIHAALSTCKHLNWLFKTSPKLLYYHAILTGGFIGNTCYIGTGSLSDRLTQLEAYEQAWRTLRWSLESLPMPRPRGGYYDLSGGQYILGVADGIPASHRRQGTTRAVWSLSLSRDSRHIEPHIEEPLRANESNPLSAWSKFHVGEDVLDFGMNISEHDLICVVTTSVSEPQPPGSLLRSMDLHFIHASSGAPHPKAQTPVKGLPPSYVSARPTILLEIVGDVLCILINFMDDHAQDVMYIMDWKAGEITMQFWFSARKYASFIFLSANVLALLSTNPFSVDLAHLPDDWNSCSVLDDKYKTRLIVTRTLLLPRLADEASVAHFSCRGAPNPSVYGTCYGRARDTPFAPNPEKAIITARIWLINAGAQVREDMLLIVHRSALLSLATQQPSEGNGMCRTEQSDTNDETWTIPWSCWGPQMTRWFSTRNTIAVWLTVSCGSRLVVAEQEDDQVHTIFSVYDFGSCRIRKALSTANRLLNQRYGNAGSTDRLDITTMSTYRAWDLDSEDRMTAPSSMTRPSWGESKLVARSTSLPDEMSLFAEEKVSSLPYIEVRRRVAGTYQCVLMDEECLLGLKGFADDDLESIDIFHVG